MQFVEYSYSGVSMSPSVQPLTRREQKIGAVETTLGLADLIHLTAPPPPVVKS